jgi:hypothetical protein
MPVLLVQGSPWGPQHYRWNPICWVRPPPPQHSRNPGGNIVWVLTMGKPVGPFYLCTEPHFIFWEYGCLSQTLSKPSKDLVIPSFLHWLDFSQWGKFLELFGHLSLSLGLKWALVLNLHSKMFFTQPTVTCRGRVQQVQLVKNILQTF